VASVVSFFTTENTEPQFWLQTLVRALCTLWLKCLREDWAKVFSDRKLPASFLQQLKELEESYLAEGDPIRQSGFGGGPVRWRSEREPILEAIDEDGDFLDIGCANGYLLECLVEWASERGIALTPFGLDHGAKLIDLAKQRLSKHKSNLYAGNAWDWKPPRQFNYVYTLHDCVPIEFLEEYIQRLVSRVVCTGGRLIIGAYGSRSEGARPFDIEGFLESRGLSVVGTAEGGDPPLTSFVWIDK